jgi:hypothetical protein
VAKSHKRYFSHRWILQDKQEN